MCDNARHPRDCDGSAGMRNMRELQFTPMPDTIEAPGLGFLPLFGGLPQPPGPPSQSWRALAATWVRRLRAHAPTLSAPAA